MAWKNVQYENGKFRTNEGGGGGGSSTFAGLDDVSFSNLQNGQVPKYNSTTGKWENANESGGGTVTDVTVDGISVVNQQGVAEIETPNAGTIEYNNQQSGLQATDVQGALDELAQSSGGVEDVEVNGTSVVNAQNVAEIKSYKEVTQAEYQALPSSKLTDNILYCIKDSAGADGFPPLIYSDEEREVGVWRDGRPLYQKTSVFTHSGISGEKNLMPIDSTWRLIKAEVFVYNSSNQRTYFFPYISSFYNSIIVIDGYLKLVSNDSWNANYSPFYITVYYTKTTDTPGSGTWTTQGGYAHHYSTTEKVIGTWIDGKPLYEKTVTREHLTRSESWQSWAHEISNIDKIINFSGRVYIVTDQDYWTIPSPRAGNTSGYSARVSKTNIIYINNIHDTNNTSDVSFTIQYTKTTD